MINDAELFYTSPACDIYYNPAINAVQTRWTGLFVHGIEFREIHDEMIRLLKLKQSDTIIADASKMQIITPDDHEWILNNWYPRALEAGFRFQALIVSKGSFAEYSIRSLVEEYDHNRIQTISFHNYEEACDWIQKKKDQSVKRSGENKS